VKLTAIAGLTGGETTVTAEVLANATAASQTARRALWPFLVVFALLLWLGDVVLRRVRLFEATVST
jgi:hypothetical protein